MQDDTRSGKSETNKNKHLREAHFKTHETCQNEFLRWM